MLSTLEALRLALREFDEELVDVRSDSSSEMTESDKVPQNSSLSQITGT